MKFIDDLLNKITMYRLMVYYLGGLLIIGVGFSALGILPYNPLYVAASAGFLISVCWLSNVLFARVWGVPANAESSLITGLILALIITPAAPNASFFFLLWAGLLAMASKYILNIRGKHVFNPAAFGVAATALFLNQSATWWVGGNLPLLIFVLIGGLLIVRKLRHFDLVLAFLAAAIAGALFSSSGDLGLLLTTLTRTPLLFFAFVMITEPLTTPSRTWSRVFYGAFVGLLFDPSIHIGSIYFTPELALVAGNIVSYIISPKYKSILKLKEIRKLASDTYEFVFSGRVPNFRPGQYAEWTLATAQSDSRGNRRYFTLASSPTESDVRLGVKFYPNPSTYKTQLAQFTEGSPILAGSIAGDFTLPWSKKKKLVFIAGGIGVTPFRSMVQYLLDKKEHRDAVLLYSNKTESEIAYKDLFDAAEHANIGFRATYTLTGDIASGWSGERGYVNEAMIQRHLPDYLERTFYISGPRGMVEAFKKTLLGMGVSRFSIKTDFFPGFA